MAQFSRIQRVTRYNLKNSILVKCWGEQWVGIILAASYFYPNWKKWNYNRPDGEFKKLGNFQQNFHHILEQSFHENISQVDKHLILKLVPIIWNNIMHSVIYIHHRYLPCQFERLWLEYIRWMCQIQLL